MKSLLHISLCRLSLFLFLICLLSSCDSKPNTNSDETDSAGVQSVDISPMQSDSVDTQMSNKVEETPAEPSVPLPKVSKAPEKYSRYFELGYKKGYDDGEDDASNDGGWETSFDDSNHYKGKAKRDYEAGYEEGYHDGYDDNRDIEEDTDPDEYFL